MSAEGIAIAGAVLVGIIFIGATTFARSGTSMFSPRGSITDNERRSSSADSESSYVSAKGSFGGTRRKIKGSRRRF
jgi:hypothetical protein